MAGNVWVRILPVALVMAVILAVMGAGKVAQPTVSAAEPAATPTPAPAAFDNQTNGFELQGVTPDPNPDAKTFLNDKKKFDETEEVFAKPEIKDKNGCVIQEKVRGGLGPVYNSTSCVACHQNAGFVVTPAMETQKGSDAVSGTSSQVSEIRAGHDEVVDVTNEAGAVIKKNQLRFRDAPGGSVIQQRAIDPRLQEHVPVEEDIRTLRIATSVLGDGFVESIPDKDITDVRDAQPPDMRGFAVCVPAVVKVKTIDPVTGQPSDFVFQARVGRFGWKSQHSSLVNFAADAYVTEMGITSPLQPDENTSLGRAVDAFDPVKDPDDPDDFKNKPDVQFGEDVEAFARFMRSTKAPPQSDVQPVPTSVTRGKELFEGQLLCGVCHHPDFTTAKIDAQFGDLKLSEHPALAEKKISPYSDFLLHDIGTGDGIVQTQYAEFPPFPLISRRLMAPVDLLRNPLNARVTYNLQKDRLNALLQCKSEPGSPDYNPLTGTGFDRRRGISPLSDIVGEPAIQVDLAQGTPRRLSSLEELSLRANELFQAPLLYTTTTAQMIRTAPLWGLRTRPQLLHDGRALTLIDAIEAHHNQAEKSRLLFNALSDAQKQEVLDFLNFL